MVGLYLWLIFIEFDPLTEFFGDLDEVYAIRRGRIGINQSINKLAPLLMKLEFIRCSMVEEHVQLCTLLFEALTIPPAIKRFSVHSKSSHQDR